MARLDPERQFLDKWQMHQVLASGDIGPSQLPQTRPSTVSNVLTMLNQHRTIFIKPVGGWGGKGITKVDAAHDTLGPVWRWQQQGQSAVNLHTREQLIQRFLTSYSGMSTIVQQAAPLRQVNGRPFDIRTLLQRDDKDDWIVSGHAVRLGGNGSVVSNVAISQGDVWALARLFQCLQIRPAVRDQIRHDLARIALSVATALDPIHPFEEIGLDLGLDRKNQLWLIEVNTNDNYGGPSHDLFAKLPKKSVYKRIEARAKSRRDALWRDILKEF